MLFEIGSGGEGLTAFLADEGLLVFVYFFVPVEVRLLIETLGAVLEIAGVRLFPSVDDFMADKAGLKVELFITIIKGTFVNFVLAIFVETVIL